MSRGTMSLNLGSMVLYKQWDQKKLADRVELVPEQDTGRVPCICKLLEQGGEMLHRMLDTTEVTGLIVSICVN